MGLQKALRGNPERLFCLALDGSFPTRRFELTKLSSLQSGTPGELLAVAKLNTLGHAAYISPEGAPGHDVIVVVHGQAKSIEVKTRQFLKRPTEITRWPVDMDAKGDADFFIFIELDLRTLSPTFYLLTNSQARESHRNYQGGGNCYPPHVRQLVPPNDFSALSMEQVPLGDPTLGSGTSS